MGELYVGIYNGECVFLLKTRDILAPGIVPGANVAVGRDSIVAQKFRLALFT